MFNYSSVSLETINYNDSITVFNYTIMNYIIMADPIAD